MQRDELVSEIRDWAGRAEQHLKVAGDIHDHLAELLAYANAQDHPQPGDKVVLRVHLGLDEPPHCPITAIVPPWPEHGLTDTGYVVLVGPERSQICHAGDFLVVQ